MSELKLLVTQLLGIDSFNVLQRHWGLAPIINGKNQLKSIEILAGLSIDNIFSTPNLPGREVRMLKYVNGQQEPEPTFADIVTVDCIKKALDSGLTIMIRRVSKYSNLCSSLKLQLSMELGCVLSDNLFITPPGCAALSQHADEHHTFNVQLEGSKLWKVYAPIADNQRTYGPTNSTDLIDESTVHAGSALYVPSKFPHEVYAVGSSSSISVAYALTPIGMSQIVCELIELGCTKGLWRIEEFEFLLGSSISSDEILEKVNTLTEKLNKNIGQMKDDLKTKVISDLAISLIK